MSDVETAPSSLTPGAIHAQFAEDSPTAASPWWAVLDAAQKPDLPQRLAQAGHRTHSLYAGDRGAMLDRIAPHLVEFSLSSRFFAWLCRRWNRPYGIIIRSRAPFDAIRRHFRRFLMARDESGKKYRFRFYDPRVLRAFLPACTPNELKQFFGPVDAFYTPTRDGQSIMQFTRRYEGLMVRTLGDRLTDGRS